MQTHTHTHTQTHTLTLTNTHTILLTTKPYKLCRKKTTLPFFKVFLVLFSSLCLEVYIFSYFSVLLILRKESVEEMADAI